MGRGDPLTGDHDPRLRLLGLINVVAGLWLLVLPFVFHLPRRYPHQLMFWWTLTTGVLVLTLAVLHLLLWNSFRAASRGNLALGLGLAASPALIGYTKYLPNGHAVALTSVFTGLGVVAGAALCLAGSGNSDQREPSEAYPAEPTAPVLWSRPAPGQPPRAYTQLAAAGRDEVLARRRLPLAWAAVATLIAAAVVLGLAVALLSWPMAIAGVVVALGGLAAAARSHLLAAVSVGQSPGGA